MIKRLITWLYERYVLAPRAREMGADAVQEVYITFEPAEELGAYIERESKEETLH